ncbi:hypothetical protein P261_00036 [Lachnospiraceae bacterium TWA4]|nr:hypothetical protein P261_00036 [Lachnospiraceae bacterium TWA4]
MAQINYSEDKKILKEVLGKSMTLYLPKEVEVIDTEAFSKVEFAQVYVQTSTKCEDFSMLCKAFRLILLYIEGTTIISRLPLSGVCGFEPYLKGRFPNYEGYDGCFRSVKDERQKIDTAISRLYYPYQLQPTYRQMYEKYLKQKYRVSIKQVIEDGNAEIFHWLFSFKTPDIYMIREFKEVAVASHQSEIVLFLMSYEREHFAKKEENFEL